MVGEQQRVNYTQTSAMLTAWKRTDELAFLGKVSSGPVAAESAAPAGRVFAILGEAGPLSAIQVAQAWPGLGRVHTVGVPLARRRVDAGEDGRAAGHPLVPAPARRCRARTVTVSRDPAGRWHVSLLCEVTVQDGPPTDAVVGIDAGITTW